MKSVLALLPAAIVAGVVMNAPAEAKGSKQAPPAEHHQQKTMEAKAKGSKSKGAKAEKSKRASAGKSRRSKAGHAKGSRHRAANVRRASAARRATARLKAISSPKPDVKQIAPVTPPNPENLMTLQELAQLRGLEDFATRHAPQPPISGFDPPSAETAHEVIATIEAMAPEYEVPTWFALRIAMVESNYNPAVRGRDGEYGVFQIKCDTARMLGFTRDCGELADAKTNIEWGLIHLSHALKLANGDLELAASKHNAGLGRQRLVRHYVSLVF
jgi:soluble lytic murein transglycosylase-like protein